MENGKKNYLDSSLIEENRSRNFRKKELNFKFIVVGDLGVGKTSIIKRYVGGEFESKYQITIGSDFSVKTLEWDNETRINLLIWDIAGHERFGSLTSVFYKHAVGALIVFDLTRPETFNSVDKWLKDFRKKVYLPGGHSIPVILLANKGDVGANVPPNINEYCKSNNIHSWLITSAKKNVHIDEAMIRLTSTVINNHNNYQFLPADNEIIKLTNEPPKQKCCIT